MKLHGPNIIATPGHGLNDRELGLMLLHAEGATTDEIERMTGMRAIDRAEAEASIRRKIGARTQPHMIARAFSLGILATRAMCLLLAVLSADYHDILKQRSPARGGRPGTVIVRIKTGGRNIWA
ncbi:hypothetical protein D3C73_284020 [compost metagenome]